MKKTITLLLVIFFVLSLFSSVAGAAKSPILGGFPVTFDDAQMQLLFPQGRLAEFQSQFAVVKMALTEAEIDALANMTSGGWFPVGFKLPPTFDGQQFNWVSSNPSVASVVFLGSRSLVLANSPGTAVITVSTADGRFSYSFTVVVK